MSNSDKIGTVLFLAAVVAVLVIVWIVGRRTKKKWKKGEYYHEDMSWWP